MLRSLVGSEMCIRDSLPLPSSPFSPKKNATARFGRPQQQLPNLLLVFCPQTEREARADCGHDSNNRLRCVYVPSQKKNLQKIIKKKKRAICAQQSVFCASFHETGATGKRTCRKRPAAKRYFALSLLTSCQNYPTSFPGTASSGPVCIYQSDPA